LDSDFCAKDTCVKIEVICGDVFVPTAFSPNGDNQNDIFYVRGKCIKEISILVFDRWGERVFESNKVADGWNGTYNGKPCGSGAFAYSIQGTLLDGIHFSKTGTVLLLK
jgi:gliding motility-associated-like protein